MKEIYSVCNCKGKGIIYKRENELMKILECDRCKFGEVELKEVDYEV